MLDDTQPIDDAIDRAKQILTTALLQARRVIREALTGYVIREAPYGIEVDANADLDWHSIGLTAQTHFTWEDAPAVAATPEGDQPSSVDLSSLEWP